MNIFGARTRRLLAGREARMDIAAYARGKDLLGSNDMRTPLPTSRWPIGALVLVCALLAWLGYLGWYLAQRPYGGLTVPRLEASLGQELPKGSTREDALAWYKGHEIQAHDIGGGLVGVIQNDSLLESAEIQMYVYFGPDGHVDRISVRRIVHFL